jgi:hypothetical protein
MLLQGASVFPKKLISVGWHLECIGAKVGKYELKIPTAMISFLASS